MNVSSNKLLPEIDSMLDPGPVTLAWFVDTVDPLSDALKPLPPDRGEHVGCGNLKML